MISQNFAILAAVLPLAGFASYIRDTLSGKAQPNRVSWSLWAAAPMIAGAAELANGTSPRITLVTFALGFGPLLVALATFARKPDQQWKLTRLDVGCGAISVLALLLWWVTGEGDVAIGFAIAADLFAALPTVAKSWTCPESETVGTYLASGTGSLITLLAVPHWQFTGYAFPAYVVAICAVIIALIKRPHRTVAGAVTR